MKMPTSAPTDILGLLNPQAEQSVLHAMRKDTNASIYLAETLTFEDFHDVRLAVVFEAIRLLLLGIEPIDTRSIMAQCSVIIRDRKLKVYIDETYIESLDAGDPRRMEMYANSVKKLSWLRKAADFTFWMTQELQGRPKPDQLFAAAQERWQMLAPKDAGSRFVYGWDTEEPHVNLLKERIRRNQEGIIEKFNWPWPSWNSFIRPLQPGFAATLAAADGVGKTTYLEMIAEHWASMGFQVVYVHLEDDLDYKRDRRLARHSGVPIDHIQDGILSPDELEKIQAGRTIINGWRSNLHYLDAAGENMATIVGELQSRVAEGVCQAVIYDYMDKTQPSRGQLQAYGTNAWERQANDMEQFKTFVQKNRIVGLTATQGNKSMYGDANATRKGIAGSISKSQKAQLVVLLARELLGPGGMMPGGDTSMGNEGEYSPIVKVRVDKQNIGRTGMFNQYMVGPRFLVRDLAKVEVERKPLDPDVKPSETWKGGLKVHRGLKDDD